MQQLERDRREFELKLFNMSQKVQEDSKKIAENSATAAEQANQWNKRMTRLVIALAVIEVVSAIITVALAFRGNSTTLVQAQPLEVIEVTATPPPTPTPVPPTPTANTEPEAFR